MRALSRSLEGGLSKTLLTGAVVLVAAAAFALKYWDYLNNPWTRNGQVRANVIQVTPRLSGPIVNLPIKDNQFVKAGDLLFEIDPRTFETSLNQARAKYDETVDDLSALAKQVDAATANVAKFEAAIADAEAEVKSATAKLIRDQANFKRYKQLLENGTISQARFDRVEAKLEVALSVREQADAKLSKTRSELLQSKANLAKERANLGAPGEDNAQLRAAKATVQEAELNYEFTQVRASVEGYVTNLTLRLGSQAVTNQPALALVDINSYWVEAYFRESYVGRLHLGDRAVVTLMSYPDTPIEGRVDSIGWGIAKDDGSTGADLLPNVSPTFEWIRLAQRVPVLIQLKSIPDGVDLRIGTTASVLVMTGTHGGNDKTLVPASPRLLQ